MDTTNLRQIAGGTVIKQADRSSTMSFILQDAIGREVDLEGETAQIALYTLKGKYWETTSQVKGSIVSFSLPGNLSEDDYILDISAAGYVFPSDRDFIIRVVKGFRDLPTTERAERAKQTFEEIRSDVEEESEKRLKVQLAKIDEKSESTIQAIEKDGQEYIKLIGTNKDNAIAEIEAKRQSSLQEINKKAELAIVDVSNQLKDYATKDDVEKNSSELQSTFYTSIAAINTEVEKKAYTEHTHSISDVSNLQTTLDNKAPKTHTHSQYLTSSTADSKYLKKGEPIELTTQQKAELKGEPGKDGVDGKQGEAGSRIFTETESPDARVGVDFFLQKGTGKMGLVSDVSNGVIKTYIPQITLKGDPGKGIVDVKSGREIKIWIGDQSDYDSISTKDGDTLYLIWE